MESLELLHAVEGFLGRDLSMADGDALIQLQDEETDERSVQDMAELFMNNADRKPLYG